MKLLDFWKAFVFLGGVLILSGALMFSDVRTHNPEAVQCFLLGGVSSVVGLIGLFFSAKK